MNSPHHGTSLIDRRNFSRRLKDGLVSSSARLLADTAAEG